jgi:ubiquitin-protein ligase E3 A
LIRALGEVFSSPDSLSISFLKQHPDSPIDAMLDKAPKDLKNLKKEDVRMMEGDMDKDEDSLETGECSLNSQDQGTSCKSLNSNQLDIPSLRRAYHALFELPKESAQFESALVYALMTLAGNVELDLRVFGGSGRENLDNVLNVLLIVFEIPVLGMSEYLEMALPKICKAAAALPVPYQAKMVQFWAKHNNEDQMRKLLTSFQQLVTLKVISSNFNSDYCVQDEDAITAPTQLLKVQEAILLTYLCRCLFNIPLTN